MLLWELMSARPGTGTEEPALGFFSGQTLASVPACEWIAGVLPPLGMGLMGVDHIHGDLEEDQGWTWISFFPQHFRLKYTKRTLHN